MSQVYKVAAELNEVEIIYPDSDGEPMAENDTQYRYIVTTKGGLVDLFRSRPAHNCCQYLRCRVGKAPC